MSGRGAMLTLTSNRCQEPICLCDSERVSVNIDSMSAAKSGGAARGRQRRGPVMADVAKLAGVSHQTVSRVLNSSDLVRPETRERVRRAMTELNYRPNSLARALVTGRSW